jgi:hemoglobin
MLRNNRQLRYTIRLKINRVQQAIENNCKLMVCFGEDVATVISLPGSSGMCFEGIRLRLIALVEGIMKAAFVVSAILFTVLSAASDLPASAENAERSLYQRLGGEPVMAKVVEQTIRQMSNDPAVNQSFDKVNLKRLDAKIVELICALAGGGCVYSGDDMKLVHQGLNISEREFYALVEALRTALHANGVGEREKNELLRLLAPMKRDVVTKQSLQPKMP